MTTPSVLVIQNGARHDYAIANAFAEANMLEALYTDLCSTPLIDALSRLPGVPSGLKKLSARRPAPAVVSRTRMDPRAAFAMERLNRQKRSPADFVAERRRIAQTQQKRQLTWGLGSATHVFSAFGEGGLLLRKARDKGLTVLSDIYVALSTSRIEWDEWKAHPDWGPKPQSPETQTTPTSNHAQDILDTTNVFVCPSRFVADDLITRWNVAPDAIRILPYAASQTWFDFVARPHPGRILFAGSATRRKGIHILAEAAQDIRSRRSDIDIIVAGHVSDEVRNHPKAKALSFMGRVPRSDMKDIFATADLFVLPTLAEGSATVVYEAMATGLPVITTAAAGSVIRHDTDGVIIPERDPHSLAHEIEAIVDDRQRRDRLSSEAQKSVQHYTPQIQAQALRDLILAP